MSELKQWTTIFMSYFLIPLPVTLGRTYEITGEEARHITQSRRIKKGEHIIVQGSNLHRFRAEVTSATPKLLLIKTIEELLPPPEPKVAITLFQALTQEQALDIILQKSTELGVASVVLFHTERTPARIPAERLAHKLERWQKIMQEAAKQSDRLVPPTLEFIANFENITEQTKKLGRVFVMDQNGQPIPSPQSSPTRGEEEKVSSPPLVGGARGGGGDGIGLFIGPEGGFTQSELTTLTALPHATVTRLGPRILRAETAAIAAITAAQLTWGDLN